MVLLVSLEKTLPTQGVLPFGLDVGHMFFSRGLEQIEGYQQNAKKKVLMTPSESVSVLLNARDGRLRAHFGLLRLWDGIFRVL